MDLSEKFIEMCEKAIEIQNMWQPAVGDWFLHDWHGTTGLGELEDSIWKDKENWERVECLTYKPSIDDFIEVSSVDGSHGVYTSSSLLKDRHIWLPCQNELQKMLQPKDKPIWWMVKKFSTWCESLPRTIDNAFASMEQLWLGYVMLELYHKVWNGEDWVKS